MKLPFPFLKAKKQSSDYYLALLLTDEKASAVILQEADTKLRTVNSHEEFFHISIEDLGREEFIGIIDKTISRAEEVLPPDIETHQTVFGVKENWVDPETKKIKKEYLEKLKKVCDALDLTPIGFMIINEAVTHLLQDEEGAPLSAVFAEIGKSVITLSLYRGGKILESVSNPHGESAPATVDKLLGHFTVPVLPARIVLFLNKPDERTQQAFISHQWSKHLPFLHIPQVTILPAKYDIKAVMFGAAAQMGFTVEATIDALVPKVSDEQTADEELLMEQGEAGHTPHEEDEHDNLRTPAEAESMSEAEQPSEVVGERGGDFGFVINGDAQEIPVHQPVHTTHVAEEDMPIEPVHRPYHEEMRQEDEEEVRPRHKKAGSPLAMLTQLKLPKNLKLPALGALKGQKTLLKILIPLAVLVVLIFGVSYFYLNVVTATVSLTMSPKTVNEETTVTFSTTASSDFSKDVIAASAITASVEGDSSTDATGKKDVGDKAKGSVTIYNNGADPVTLSSGTELKASSGQVYTLDGSVKVPASEGDVFTGTKPGTADASVTASTLGTDGNIPSGTRFSIGSNSDLAAKNDNAFSGGTKKNVTVVSKADLAKLRADLIKKLQGQGQSALESKASDGQTVLPFASDPSLDKEKFDKKEGDEAKKVTLHASVLFSGMSYQNDELTSYAQTILKNKYAQDDTFANGTMKETVKNVKQKNAKSASADVSLEAGLLPKIDTNDVISNIQDKSLGKAKDTIANLPQVSQTDISFSPPIPLLPNLFPRLPKHITVAIKTQ